MDSLLSFTHIPIIVCLYTPVRAKGKSVTQIILNRQKPAQFQAPAGRVPLDESVDASAPGHLRPIAVATPQVRDPLYHNRIPCAALPRSGYLSKQGDLISLSLQDVRWIYGPVYHAYTEGPEGVGRT